MSGSSETSSSSSRGRVSPNEEKSKTNGVPQPRSNTDPSSGSDDEDRPPVHRKVMGRPGSATNSQRTGSAGAARIPIVASITSRPSSGTSHNTAAHARRGIEAEATNEHERTEPVKHMQPNAAVQDDLPPTIPTDAVDATDREQRSETEPSPPEATTSAEVAVPQPTETSADENTDAAAEKTDEGEPVAASSSVAVASREQQPSDTAENAKDGTTSTELRDEEANIDAAATVLPGESVSTVQQDEHTPAGEKQMQEEEAKDAAPGSGYENDEYEDEFEELSPVKDGAASSGNGGASADAGVPEVDSNDLQQTMESATGGERGAEEAPAVVADAHVAAVENNPQTTADGTSPRSQSRGSSSSSRSASASSSSSSSYHPIDSSPERVASIRQEVAQASHLRRESLNTSTTSSGHHAAAATTDVVPLAERLKQVAGAHRPETREGRRGAPTGRRPSKPSSEAKRSQMRISNGGAKPATNPSSEDAIATNTPQPQSVSSTVRAITTETPIRVEESDTVASVFLRPAHEPSSTRGSSRPGRLDEGKASGSLSGRSVVHIDNIRRWISPYECPVNHHPRLVLRDVQELEEQRRQEALEHKMSVEQRKAEGAKRLREEEEAKHRVKVAATSPRLCKPRHQHPPVGVYATATSPRPLPSSSVSPSDSSSRRASTAVGGTKGDMKKTDTSSSGSLLPTMASLYANGDMPHYMLPRPPPREPKPISFQPDTRQFRRNGPLHSAEEDDDENGGGGGGGPAVLSEEEFALRFFTQQVEQRKNALNRSFLKLTGAPMPEVVPRKATSPSRRAGSNKHGGAEELHDAAGDDGGADDDDDDEAKDAREEFEREIGRKFHDDEIASRSHRKALLYTKYGIVPPPSIDRVVLHPYHHPGAGRSHSPTATTNRSRSQTTTTDAAAAAAGDASARGSFNTKGGSSAKASPTSRGAASSPPLSQREALVVQHAYVEAVAQQRAAHAALWNAMEKQTYDESVHRRVEKMTKEKWSELLSRNLK